MRTLSTPGIYFEQQDSAPAPVGALRTDVAGFVGIASRGPLHKAVRIESLTQFASVFGGPIAQGYLAHAVQCFFANGGVTCWVVRVADPNRARPAFLEIADGSTTVLRLTAGSPGTWGNEIIARWMTHAGRIASITLRYPDGTQELIRNPAAAPSEGLTLLDPTRSMSFSRNAAQLLDGEGRLSGGRDGLATLTASHITGEDAPQGVRWGLALLDDVDEVSMVAVPDIMQVLRVPPPTVKPRQPDCRALDQPIDPEPLPEEPPEFPPQLDASEMQAALIRHCERMRYRVAILDTKQNVEPQNAGLEAEPFRSTTFGALYYPWIDVDDPLRLTGLVRRIPPSGAVAGIYARSDRLYGVHKPPANEVVQGALDVEQSVDDVMHGELNDAGVNVIRSYPGRGIRVYGGRTTSTDLTWRYIHVRRLVSMIEKAIDRATQWAVFEPNSRILRRDIDRSVRSFLESLFRSGMLGGGSSDEAYSVQCDADTTPREEEDAGRVICIVGVQPPPPAEFVVVVIGRTQNAMEILKEGGAIDA